VPQPTANLNRSFIANRMDLPSYIGRFISGGDINNQTHFTSTGTLTLGREKTFIYTPILLPAPGKLGFEIQDEDGTPIRVIPWKNGQGDNRNEIFHVSVAMERKQRDLDKWFPKTGPVTYLS